MSITLASTGFDSTIRLWSVTDHTEEHKFHIQGKSQINCLALSEEQDFLVAGGASAIYKIMLYEYDKAIETFQHHSGNVTDVKFYPRSQFVISSSEDGTVKFWNFQDRTIPTTFDLQTPVNCVCVLPVYGIVVAGTSDGRIHIINLKSSEVSHVINVKLGVSVQSISATSDGVLVFVGMRDGEVLVFSTISQEDEHFLPYISIPTHQRKDESDMLPLLMKPRIPTPDIDVCDSGWILHTRFKPHKKYLLKVCVCPLNMYFATASADCTAKVYNILDGLKPVNTFVGHRDWVFDVEFNSNSEFIVTGSSDCCVNVYDLESDTAILSFQGHEKPVTSIIINDVTAEEEDSDTESF
ncbi:hypothetical protein PCE1_001255 [Barthelona sp. PCE]